MAKRRTFDEIYPSKPGFGRYDSSREASMKRRAQRKPSKYDGISYVNDAGKVRRIKAGLPGYTVVNYAFKDAAETYTGHGMNTGYYSWTPLGVAVLPEGMEPWKAEPEEASRVVKKAAQYYGACDVGTAVLDRRWINTHSGDREIVFEDVEAPYVTDKKAVIPESCKWVVAILVPMEQIENSYAPTPLEVTSNMGYSRMHATAGCVAEFIRGLGYNAIPCGNDTAQSVPIAIQAGLGHVGRNGRLINWKRGLLTRICKVFTDLPLAQDEIAPEGIMEFCEVCEKCARHCGSRSIPTGPRTYEGTSPSNNNGILKWYCHEESCSQYWNEVGTGCSMCIRVCPWSKKENDPMHRFVVWCIRNVPQLNKVWAWADDAFGYGKMSDPRSYWDKPYEPS